MTTFESDHDYDELPLEEVTREGKGYVLKRDGWSLFIDDPGFEPKAGMMARYYGKGIGYGVRGVVLDGKVCRYQTHEQAEAEQAARTAKWNAEQAEIEAKVKASGRSEKAMREEKVPWPKTIEELTAYIQKQVDGPHDYGTCVYAMSLAATAAYHFVAHALGTTGFQASCADLDIIRRTRGIKGPFMLIKADDALYPQYDLRAKLDEALTEWRPWMAEKAQELLRDSTNRLANENVRAHWERLSVTTTHK